jgi:surfactin synthase thioesterase subunit
MRNLTRDNATRVNTSESVEKQIAALAAACGGTQPDVTDQRKACERLIATTRADIDVSASYNCLLTRGLRKSAQHAQYKHAQYTQNTMSIGACRLQ